MQNEQIEALEGFTYYECRECGFDSTLAGPPSRDECPICAGDTGHSNIMRTRIARLSDKPEGRDDAAALRAKGQTDEG
tara:strand:+ start:3902 stop:4135 length:234 start_codon:yes stop_codon:yes gene_type:complete